MESNLNTYSNNFSPESKYIKTFENSTTQTDICVLNACYYYRWSTPGQLKEKRLNNGKLSYEEREEIIKAQVEGLVKSINSYRQFCPKCGKEIRIRYIGKGYLDKKESGRNTEREDIENCIEDADTLKEFNVVFTPMSSRIGRRRSVSATIRDRLKDLGVQMYSTSQPIPLKCVDCFDPLNDDAAIFNETLADLQAEIDLATIRRNYLFGMPLRIEKGKPAGCTCYGLIRKCKVVKDINGNEGSVVWYEWDQKKVYIVKRIAKEYLAGLGVWKICQNLNLEKIPSPQNKAWCRSAVLYILRNPEYMGKIRFGRTKTRYNKRIIQQEDKWKLEKAMFKGIWGETYFQKIKDEMKRRATMGGRAQASTGLLIGILKCAFCHYSMFQSSTREIRNGKPYIYQGYACGTFMHRGACHSNGKSQKIVDGLVLREVLKLTSDETKKVFYQKLNFEKGKNIEETLNSKKTALLNAKKELERVSVAYKHGIDSLDEYATHKNELVPLINQLAEEVSKLAENKHKSSNFSWEASYESAIRRFKEYPTDKDKMVVKRILSKLIEKIEIENIPHKRKGSKIKIFYRLD